MKKVIKLTENDIEGLVKKIISEEGKKDESWPKELKKGRFTTWCKRNGFEQGASISCAKKAMKSDDDSVRGMASFYMNTVKPKGKTSSDLKEARINEALPERELRRKLSNYKKSEFTPYEREEDIKGLFGSYGEDIPVQVLQYLRKNPFLLIKRLVKTYGADRIYDYIDKIERSSDK